MQGRLSACGKGRHDGPASQIAGLEPTYSALEAAALLQRSNSWLDQRLRPGEFVAYDGSVLEPFRAVSGYRYFTIEMLRDVAAYCYRRRWYSFEELKSVLRQLAMDVQCGTGDERDPKLSAMVGHLQATRNRVGLREF